MFPYEFYEIFNNAYFEEHMWTFASRYKIEAFEWKNSNWMKLL